MVLPTFAVVAPSLHSTAPRIRPAGVDIDMTTALHASQRIDLHGPLATDAAARSSARVTSVLDKGSAAVIETTTSVADPNGTPLWTATSCTFARGEGGFGGDRGAPRPPGPPPREPDAVLVTPTLPQQALLYRLVGDRNPLHFRPSYAARAGFPRPILHGLCTYGMVCKAVVDAELGGEVALVGSYSARFSGVVYPGETLRTSVWREDGRIVLATTVDERGDAPALSDAQLVLVS